MSFDGFPEVARELVDAQDLQRRLGYSFVDPQWCELALRHRSWCAENGMVESNERLEFLGDAVLGMVVANWLYSTSPDAPEGSLARWRAELVNGRVLAKAARTLNLGPVLRLGRGEASTGGADKSSILADAVEAIIGAVFLDAGLSAATQVILHLLGDQLDQVTAGAVSDFKSALQEHGAGIGLGVPAYDVADDGPEHSKTFNATVTLGTDVAASGSGRSKKEAEQAAAQAAYHLITGGSPADPSESGDAVTAPSDGASHG